MAHTPQKSSGATEPRRSIPPSVWALIIAVLIGGWLWTGQLAPASDTVETAGGQTSKVQPENLFKVSTRTLVAKPRPAELVIRGQTKSPARVQVRAETPGVIEKISDKKGRLVERGELLCQLKVGARRATLTEAEGALAQAESDFASSNKLSRSGFAAVARKNADKARLDAARAALTRAKLDLERIEVRAPFRGVIEDQPAKTGDFLRQADVCATIVKVDPVLLTGAVSERDLAKVSTGMPVTGVLVTGETVRGKITFISPSSDATTRTFTFEASIPNPDRKIRAGVTADIKIKLDGETAHRVSASTLSLDDNGQVGLKIVENADTVRFIPITILSNEKDALWVSGLPSQVKVITVGQEYVVDGQRIEAVSDADQSSAITAPAPTPATQQTNGTNTLSQPKPPTKKPRA